MYIIYKGLFYTRFYGIFLFYWFEKKKYCYIKVLSMYFIEEFMNYLDSIFFLLELSKKILLF